MGRWGFRDRENLVRLSQTKTTANALPEIRDFSGMQARDFYIRYGGVKSQEAECILHLKLMCACLNAEVLQ